MSSTEQQVLSEEPVDLPTAEEKKESERKRVLREAYRRCVRTFEDAEIEHSKDSWEESCKSLVSATFFFFLFQILCISFVTKEIIVLCNQIPTTK